MARVVLVTGVSRYLGARAANVMRSASGVERVIGVDSRPSRYALPGVEFVHVDPSDDTVGTVIRDSGADTVLHLNLVAHPEGAGESAGAAKENNILGAMQVLAACQRSTAVSRIVLRSTAAVYGASSRDCDLHTEDSVAQGSRGRYGSSHADDAIEVERHARQLRRRRSDIAVAVLRFANFIGPAAETPLTRYLERAIVPTVLGHDPRMQFIHEDDAVEVIRRMALSTDGQGGVFNVAAPGAMPLSQCLRRAGRPEMPVPEHGLRVLNSLTPGAGFGYSPERLRTLCYGRVLDSSKLERALGWRPSYTSQEAFDSYVAEQRYKGTAPARFIGNMTHRVRAAVSR
ncbi:NAD-dependent epimerase/dehydratase family protein [Salinactinospora qingdaonensis]|uniref:NAD-dependent epimerase/dehydratase family protein n=1 Tax=Salinactinospora qingdaonensis TaxID=702744 RepID=A0ABP7F2J2_9ACTN